MERPDLVAPSPNDDSATFGRPCIWNPTAAPSAIGSPAPTIALAPMLPREKSIRCIDPPTPPEPPLALPISSANAVSEVIPSASASPWPRYVLVWTSPGCIAAMAPTETASWPWQRWVVPSILPLMNSSWTLSSNCRIRTIVRYQASRSALDRGSLIGLDPLAWAWRRAAAAGVVGVANMYI